jgi:hypothetical protein
MFHILERFRSMYKALFKKLEGKRPVAIKLMWVFKKMQWGGLDCIHVAEVWDK